MWTELHMCKPERSSPARGQHHAADDEGEADEQIPVAYRTHHRILTTRDVEHGDPGQPEHEAEHHHGYQPPRADLGLGRSRPLRVDRLLYCAGPGGGLPRAWCLS